MKKCKRCEKEHDGSFGSGLFCSRSCANSRKFSVDAINKKRAATLKWLQNNPDKVLNYRSNDELKRTSNKKLVLKSKERKEVYNKICEQEALSYKEKILTTDFNDLKYGRLRDRIIFEQNETCNKCERDTWLEQKIPLELEHKDGDNKNNSRENLEALCPNCHALTKTWRGRNKKTKRTHKTDLELYEAYCEHKNIRQALLSLGIAAKGSNYRRMYQVIDKFAENS